MLVPQWCMSVSLVNVSLSLYIAIPFVGDGFFLPLLIYEKIFFVIYCICFLSVITNKKIADHRR